MLYNPIFFQSNTKNIEDYTILRERHSGTNWLERIVYSRLTIPRKNPITNFLKSASNY